MKGTVTETVNLLFMKYFVVRDDTGEIPIVTERILPARGEAVTIQGEVQEAFALGDERLIVIAESSSHLPGRKGSCSRTSAAPTCSIRSRRSTGPSPMPGGERRSSR